MRGNLKNICVVTGTRAEYGLLKHLLKAVAANSKYSLTLLVTGSHLSERLGSTYKEIEADGLIISRKIDIQLEGDGPLDVANSTALALNGFAKAYSDFSPDLVILLGDRYELLGAAIAAMIQKIPIAHIHGGEVTIGAMDEGIRHALTKFSHIHFVANDEYRSRVIQLGEDPNMVFNVGGLGVDAISRVKLLSRAQIEKKLGFKFGDKSFLITFHPVTLESSGSANQMNELLKVLSARNDVQLIFTMPNADTDNKILFDMIKSFVEKNKNAYVFSSLGQLLYFSCVAQVDLVIGNSSSGLLEVPTFKKPTINIGDRQSGRIKATSVIDCMPNFDDINHAIDWACSSEFKKITQDTINPYGVGGAVEKILEVLGRISLAGVLKKQFYDLDVH